MRNTVTVHYGIAERVFVPFGDAWSAAHYRPARWEGSGPRGTYTTEAGRRRVVSRLREELRTDPAVRVVADAYAGGSLYLFYRVADLPGIRFWRVRVDAHTARTVVDRARRMWSA